MSEVERAKELFFEALSFVDASDFGNAELRFREALRCAPENAAILTNLSGVLLQQNNHVEARACAEKAISTNPDNIEALLVLAACRVHDERLVEALAVYDQIISLNPTIADAHNNRGIVLERLGRPADALASYERAISLEPRLSAAYLNRGNALDDPIAALAAYDQALALDPDLAQAWLGRGNVFHRLERDDDALAAYDQALALNPMLARAWVGRGNVFCKRKRYDEGVTAYERALSLTTNIADAWLGRGNALRELKRCDEALADYEKALSLTPDLAEAWVGRGNAYHDLKRYDDGLAAYDHAIALSPRFAQAWQCRGDALVALRRVDEAIAAYRQALALGGNAELIKYFLAALGAEPPPVVPPQHYIVDLFDAYADHFEQELVDKLKYRTPRVLAEAIKRFVPSHKLDIVDLGCGTGLLGEMLRPLAHTLTGVDLSAGMLDVARRRKIYDHLIASELVRFLETREKAYDLAVATDVFIYLGDLSPVFRAVQHALKAAGLFCFSVEATDVGDFVLRDTLRYAHSADYLRKLAQHHRFAVAMIERHTIRQDRNADVLGYHAILRSAA